MALKKTTGKGYKKGQIRPRTGSKTSRNSAILVPKSVLRKTLTFSRESLTRETQSRETPFPTSNFDLLDAVKKLRIKHFRGVFMRYQLPQRPNGKETGIINLDNKNGPGTHWIAYAIDPCGIIDFDSYGLAPPVEFLKYVSGLGLV